VMLGLLLSRRGWHVTFLGADTPLDTLEATVAALRPTLVVLGTYDARLFRSDRGAIARLAARTRLVVAGPLAEDEVAAAGAEWLAGDIAEAAERLRARR
jgi:MerR family transcriptional regulator, light-induced transcriptional regulator